MRSQTRKTINFLTLERKFIKFKLSFSSLTSVFHRVSHFRFQSFISLIRLEKRSELCKKFAKISKKFASFTHSPHQLFSKNFTSSPTLTTPNSQKRLQVFANLEKQDFQEILQVFEKDT